MEWFCQNLFRKYLKQFEPNTRTVVAETVVSHDAFKG